MYSQAPTITLAKDLICRRSVTPDDAGCQQLISSRLKMMGFTIEHIDCGAVRNLWARKGDKNPLLVFVGHTDVVPTGDPNSWSFPPYSAEISDGYLYGRGAADMKGSVAAMVTACERFFNRQEQIAGSVALLLTSDEEGDAIDGTVRVVDKLMKRGEQIDYCLVGEPTCESVFGDTVKIGRRGSISGRITVHGKQGHVAYPHLADNPIHKSGNLIAELGKLKWDDGDDVFPATTLQVSNVKSGVGADNVIPGELCLQFNIRFSPKDTVEQLIEQIEQIPRTLDMDVDLNWGSVTRPYYTKDRDFAELVCNAISELVCVAPNLSTAGGTSDGRFVAKTGAQVVEFGPMNKTIHQIDECVSVDDLNRLSDVYERILQKTLVLSQ